ncbi:hypothetical protein GTO10_03260 [Candidatus Saccharibacteria bacterium]|nr:hypothetical protein [candidate division Zixibacteria bacterium]NIT03926.1 hypothetical protein [Candidatus Saccharibacteria bacterium]
MKRDLHGTEKLQLCREILTYLTEHHNASDTVEGITQWWLLEQRIRHEVAMVKEALAELVIEGLVLEYQGGDLQTHYRINQKKCKEIKAVVKQ